MESKIKFGARQRFCHKNHIYIYIYIYINSTPTRKFFLSTLHFFFILPTFPFSHSLLSSFLHLLFYSSYLSFNYNFYLPLFNLPIRYTIYKIYNFFFISLPLLFILFLLLKVRCFKTERHTNTTNSSLA